MKRTYFLLFLLCSFLGFDSNGQSEEMSQEIQEMYYSKEINVGEFDPSMYDSLEYGNTVHPVQLLTMCSGFVQDSMLNEAAVLFFVGRFRFKLYNKTDPNYEASGGGALAGSLASVYGGFFNDYLNKNLQNYGEIVEASGKWYEENKHFYFDHPVNDSLYQAQVDGFYELSDMLLNNPKEYIEKLEDQRKKLEELMRQLEKDLEEMGEEEFDFDEE